MISWYDVFDKVLKLLFWVMVALIALSIVIICVYLIPRDIDRVNRAEKMAQQMGCEYIGSARDLNSVKVFDCNGEIVMKRVK